MALIVQIWPTRIYCILVCLSNLFFGYDSRDLNLAEGCFLSDDKFPNRGTLCVEQRDSVTWRHFLSILLLLEELIPQFLGWRGA